MLNKYLLKGKDYQHTQNATYPSKIDEKAEKVWFCGEYQRNKCSHKSSHLKAVKGEQRLAMDICASCWLKDKKKAGTPRKLHRMPTSCSLTSVRNKYRKDMISDNQKKINQYIFPKIL